MIQANLERIPKRMKRLQSLLLCLLAVCLCGIPAKAEEAPPEFTWTNTNSQDYDRWATTVNSYLVPDGNGWMVLDMDPSKGVSASQLWHQ